MKRNCVRRIVDNLRSVGAIASDHACSTTTLAVVRGLNSMRDIGQTFLKKIFKKFSEMLIFHPANRALYQKIFENYPPLLVVNE